MGYFWNLVEGSILSAWLKDLFTENHKFMIDKKKKVTFVMKTF